MKQVLDIGNCEYDHSRIRGLVESLGARCLSAKTASAGQEKLKTQRFDLVLVNRLLDEDQSSGVELISRLQSDPRTKAIPAMLISNFPEAQAQAQAAGAVAGFGKEALAAPQTAELLSRYLK